MPSEASAKELFKSATFICSKAKHTAMHLSVSVKSACKKEQLEGGTAYGRADWSIQGDHNAKAQSRSKHS
jgi:hypothetical protein